MLNFTLVDNIFTRASIQSCFTQTKQTLQLPFKCFRNEFCIDRHFFGECARIRFNNQVTGFWWLLYGRQSARNHSQVVMRWSKSVQVSNICLESHSIAQWANRSFEADWIKYLALNKWFICSIDELAMNVFPFVGNKINNRSNANSYGPEFDDLLLIVFRLVITESILAGRQLRSTKQTIHSGDPIGRPLTTPSGGHRARVFDCFVCTNIQCDLFNNSICITHLRHLLLDLLGIYQSSAEPHNYYHYYMFAYVSWSQTYYHRLKWVRLIQI